MEVCAKDTEMMGMEMETGMGTEMAGLRRNENGNKGLYNRS